METLKGILERIVYQSKEDGYVVARFSSPDYPRELLTVIGTIASATPGQNLELQGWWVNHPKYGRQFKIQQYKTILPATIVGMKKYLGSGLIKMIGPVMAKRIVEHFGLKTLEIIENYPQRLTEVEGIGPKRRDNIIKSWQEQRRIKEVMLFLYSHNVSTAFAVKIYKTYQDQAIEIIKENPYRLAENIFGIGFKTADAIAESLGIEKDSPLRVESGVRYTLSQCADDGHVFLPFSKLIEESSRILKVEGSSIGQAVKTLQEKKTAILEDNAVYLAPFYQAEMGVARRMGKLLRTNPYLKLDLEESIARVERKRGIEFAFHQKEAIRKGILSKVMILTGGPGTGKTTTIMGIIELLRQLKLKVLLAAPTGRAAKRLSEATGREARTIHRLLEYAPREGFRRNERNLLKTNAVVVDEASMIDLILLNNLLKALHPTCRLILVGDVDQLPSVGAGNVLEDLINSGVIETIRLNKIFRQARESQIVVNAHRINQGKFPLLEKKKDFFFIEKEDPEKIAGLIKDLCCKHLPRRGFHSFEDIQVLSPMYRGPVGVNSLNQMLQEVLNPPKTSFSHGGRVFRLGDKVMQIRNNYDKEVFNGDIGRIAAIDLQEEKITVSFPQGRVSYDPADLNELTMAYAISVHKSQGSEYRSVIMPLVMQHYIMLQRNLLYTAVTRAKQLMILIGSKKALAIAVKNNKVRKRYSRLAERLKEKR